MNFSVPGFDSILIGFVWFVPCLVCYLQIVEKQVNFSVPGTKGAAEFWHWDSIRCNMKEAEF